MKEKNDTEIMAEFLNKFLHRIRQVDLRKLPDMVRQTDS